MHTAGVSGPSSERHGIPPLAARERRFFRGSAGMLRSATSMWYFALIAIINMSFGYMLAVHLGYAAKPDLRAFLPGRRTHSAEIPDISDEDVIVAEHPHEDDET